MYVYQRAEGERWTVGHYRPDGGFEPESDHSVKDEAAKRTAWLNGSDYGPDGEDLVATYEDDANAVYDYLVVIQSPDGLVGNRLLEGVKRVGPADIRQLEDRYAAEKGCPVIVTNLVTLAWHEMAPENGRED